MKLITTVMTLVFSLGLFASDPVYPVKNIPYFGDQDYHTEVLYSDKYVVMLFSNDSCLERAFIDRSCWLFEKKLDYFVPKFSSKVKVMGFNTFFDNYIMVRDFAIHKIPTVVIMKNGKIYQRFEPDLTIRRPNGSYPFSWEDQLLQDVLDVVGEIR